MRAVGASLTERIYRVRHNERSDVDYIAAMYYPGIVDVYWTLLDAERGDMNHPAAAAGVLLHEAGHFTAPNHEGTSLMYDLDSSHSYGSEARWLSLWLAHNEDPSGLVAGALDNACMRVADDDGFDACDGVRDF